MAGAEAAPPAAAAGEDEVAVLQAPVHCRLAMEGSMEWSMQVSTSTLRATTAACPAEAPSDTEPKCRDEAEEKVEGDPTCRTPPRVLVLACLVLEEGDMAVGPNVSTVRCPTVPADLTALLFRHLMAEPAKASATAAAVVAVVLARVLVTPAALPAHGNVVVALRLSHLKELAEASVAVVALVLAGGPCLTSATNRPSPRDLPTHLPAPSRAATLQARVPAFGIVARTLAQEVLMAGALMWALEQAAAPDILQVAPLAVTARTTACTTVVVPVPALARGMSTAVRLSRAVRVHVTTKSTEAAAALCTSPGRRAGPKEGSAAGNLRREVAGPTLSQSWRSERMSRRGSGNMLP
mmetsp:Transcript_133616/g.427240  ORF Transcript_133616/g.427240 Transcript_133616/m.427240 type:complete len:352 (+) Transcript_133616:735-1790(+)